MHTGAEQTDLLACRLIRLITVKLYRCSCRVKSLVPKERLPNRD